MDKTDKKLEKVIFFGNGALSQYVLEALSGRCEVIFHARTREDLDEACEMKRLHPEAHGVLASYGVMIREPVLELFEPEGILNVHPSLLPLYRGASPIESAILAGDTKFGVSVMKLVKAMDAGPIYGMATLENPPIDKDFLYRELATMGAEIVMTVILGAFDGDLIVQDESRATYTRKFEKADGVLEPSSENAEAIFRKIVAFQGFPKPKYAFFGVPCTILEAHVAKVGETADLILPCRSGAVVVDSLQPDGRKAMDAKSFVNGYKK